FKSIHIRCKLRIGIHLCGKWLVPGRLLMTVDSRRIGLTPVDFGVEFLQLFCYPFFIGVNRLTLLLWKRTDELAFFLLRFFLRLLILCLECNQVKVWITFSCFLIFRRVPL